jgi:hypothetical protein
MLHTKPAHPARPELVADWERLFQVFIRPEDDACRTTLIKYMERILFGLHDFQKRYVGITEAKSLKDLSESFTSTIISENPEKKTGRCNHLPHQRNRSARRQRGLPLFRGPYDLGDPVFHGASEDHRGGPESERGQAGNLKGPVCH